MKRLTTFFVIALLMLSILPIAVFASWYSSSGEGSESLAPGSDPGDTDTTNFIVGSEDELPDTEFSGGHVSGVGIEGVSDFGTSNREEIRMESEAEVEGSETRIRERAELDMKI